MRPVLHPIIEKHIAQANSAASNFFIFDILSENVTQRLLRIKLYHTKDENATYDYVHVLAIVKKIKRMIMPFWGRELNVFLQTRQEKL